eukprot:TRINITY_DN1702_c0_g1_i1.p2 TRINITY_DN1702_c0_g1~~TRINITY_DN1702_c0_g1_i1.p2  ORF type:complete len:164 (-),score=44.23 TRINITY_DN1702_c0_g1_i1:718-1209(-)
MGSLMPGWDQNVVVSNIDKEDEGEYVPWWLRGQKDVVNLKDTESRLARNSVEFHSLARTSADFKERRRSAERRSSFEFDTSGSEGEAGDDGEVDDSGKVKLFWWRRMNTSALNERPDTKSQDYRTGSYQPQFQVAGNYNYAALAPAKNTPPPVHEDKQDLIVL